jgi:HK97 gp10 family phage protein
MITIIGAEQAIARFTALAALGSTIGTAITSHGAEIVIDQMRSRAPVDTGVLRDSIGIVDAVAGIESSVDVGASAEYDRYVQFGTHYMQGQPYAEEAGDAAADEVFGLAASLVSAVV